MSEKKQLVAATNLSRRAVLDARPQKDKRAQDKLHNGRLRIEVPVVYFYGTNGLLRREYSRQKL